MALGSLPLSLPLLISLAFVLVVLGIVGRYIDEVSDDNERMILYEEHLKEFLRREYADETSSSTNPHTSRDERIQLSNSEDKECSDRDNDVRESGG